MNNHLERVQKKNKIPKFSNPIQKRPIAAQNRHIKQRLVNHLTSTKTHTRNKIEFGSPVIRHDPDAPIFTWSSWPSLRLDEIRLTWTKTCAHTHQLVYVAERQLHNAAAEINSHTVSCPRDL